MLEGCFKHFATNFRNFPKTSDDFQRFLKKNFKMLEGRFEHFETFSNFSEDLRRFLKIFKNFGVVGILFLHSPVLFISKFCDVIVYVLLH